MYVVMYIDQHTLLLSLPPSIPLCFPQNVPCICYMYTHMYIKQHMYSYIIL